MADEKSDLYSVGVVLYEMLTGQVPFDGDTAVSVALKHVSEEPRSMRDRAPNISRALDEVVMRALAKDSARRYQTAAEFAGDLRKAVVRPRGGFVTYPLTREEQERQREEQRRKALRRKRRLQRVSFFAAIFVGVAVIGSLVWYFAAVYNMESVPLTIGSEEAAATAVISQRGFIPWWNMRTARNTRRGWSCSRPWRQARSAAAAPRSASPSAPAASGSILKT